jgi:predicted nucleotide-binding protein
MNEVISEQIDNIIENKIFNLLEIEDYFKPSKLLTETQNLKSFISQVNEIDDLKTLVYNHVMILEPFAKQLFFREFISKLSEYTDSDISYKVGIKILEEKKIEPQINNLRDAIGYGCLNKLNYYDLDNLDFNFESLNILLSEPFFKKRNDVIKFINEYASDYNIVINESYKIKNLHSNKIFVVHGHNDILKFEISNTLQKLGLEPIILHEQASSNRTIIEKLEYYKEVKYAIIIMSDDDLGGSKMTNEFIPRARQNVVFEMGYFFGVLGRKNVVCILNNSKIERPSDIDGIVYLDYNNTWQMDLIKELKAVGFNLNLENYFQQ